MPPQTNMTQGQVLGIPVSGVPRDAAVLDFGAATDASGLLSGGEFGLEDSLVVTALMVLACVLADRYYLGVEASLAPEPASSTTA